MNRRTLFGATAALLLTLTSTQALAGKRVDVVKVMSLTCPVCRAAETHDGAIAQAVREAGGQFVWAPLPTEEEAAMGARERVYYAARDTDKAMGEKIKQSLYKGAQDMGVPLNDYLQVYTWLSQDVPELEPRLQGVFQKAQERSAQTSLSRAARLASQAGVAALPGYVLIVDGRVVANVDPESVPGESLLKLRDEVIARVHKLANQ